MWKESWFFYLDTLQGDHDPGRQNRGQGYKGQGQRGHRPPPAIHTVKEDPDMPDSQVIVSKEIYWYLIKCWSHIGI
jgi:hypothetical protein